MTDLAAAAAGNRAARAKRPAVAAVADNFVALMRIFNRARARMLAAAAHDVEWSAHVVLKCLDQAGPLRASALAEFLQSDPSTVSRQVATLVKDGLIERRADPADGRASLLVLTERADAVLAEHDTIRLDYFASVLDSWSDADQRMFAGLLGRFASDYDAVNATWLADRFTYPSSATGSPA